MSSSDTIIDSAEHDAALLGRIAGGDRESFAALYDRYSKPLFAFALRILGNAADAEDVLQEVFMQIWNALANLTVRKENHLAGA